MRTLARSGLLALPLLLASGCGLVAFDVDVDAETTIEGGGGVLDELLGLGFGAFGGIELADTREFRNHDVRPEDVESITLKSLVLEVTAPEGGDLSFLEALSFYVEADGAPRVRVARAPAGAFEAGVSRVTLETEDVELKPYATAPAMRLTTEATATGRPPQDTTVRAVAVFHVDPNIVGT